MSRRAKSNVDWKKGLARKDGGGQRGSARRACNSFCKEITSLMMEHNLLPRDRLQGHLVTEATLGLRVA